jgi:ABC-type transport system involved in multi-copper enzyme maturation permease subunit
MIRSFIKKEIYQNIATSSFWLLCGIIFSLNLLGMFMQIVSYNSSKKAFQEYYFEHQKFSSLTDKEDVQFDMAIMPPAHLGMMFTGPEQFVGFRAIDQNSIKCLFRNIDFGALTGILFSLLAIILSFQAISGEREDGLLKLIDSYPVKRAKIIIGKWLGIVIIIGILYTLCYIINILLIVCYSNTQLSIADVTALFLVYLIGFFYISGMVLLGIYISIRIRHSHLSLLTALLVWAFVILVLPSVPDYAGRLFVKVPSDLQILSNEINRNSDMESAAEKIKEKYRKRGIAEDKIEQQASAEIEKSNNLLMEQDHKTKEHFDFKIIQRLAVSTGTSFFSPYACYTLAVNEFAATGISVNILLNKQSERFRESIRKYHENIEKHVKEDTHFKPDNNNIPKFEMKYTPIKIRLVAAAIPFVLLLVFNIIFFVFSFKAFLKYDVR